MRSIKGISQKIDSCGGMIHSHARKVHFRIGQSNRGWIDLEDVVQDGLLAAVVAERKHNPQGKASFSTYLHTGLRNHFSRQLLSPLSQQKRTVVGTVSLDDISPILKAAPMYSEFENEQAILQAVRLCSRLSGGAAAFFVGGLLCRKWASNGFRPPAEMGVLAEIHETADALSISMEDLLPLAVDEIVRKKALTQLSGIGSLGLGNEMAARLLECVRCTAQLPISSIQSGRYVVETMTCKVCYLELQQAPSEESCFAKEYDREAVECQIHCADKKVCQACTEVDMDEKALDNAKLDDLDKKAASAKKKDKPAKAAKKTEAAPAVKTGSAKKTKTSAPAASDKKSAKKEKAEKPAKAKKTKEPDPDAPPAEIGERWPFKKGSLMLYAFRTCLDGVKTATLEKAVVDAGYKFASILGAMRRDEKWVQRNPTHTWKLKEDGGFLKIYDVKQIKAKKAAAAE